MFGKRFAFWCAVGGVSLLANFSAELVNDKFPNLGLARFLAYAHRGGTGN